MFSRDGRSLDKQIIRLPGEKNNYESSKSTHTICTQNEAIPVTACAIREINLLIDQNEFPKWFPIHIKSIIVICKDGTETVWAPVLNGGQVKSKGFMPY